jgi:RNA polymerase sigma-70 factor, ECF subfamily
MTKRANQQWLDDLRSTGMLQEESLEDLRKIILTALPYALEKWFSPNDPKFNSFIEEVAQETTLRVMEHLDSFEGRSQFTTWVHTIAVRIALTELRHMKWREVSLDDLLENDEGGQAPHEMPDKSPGIENQVENNAMLSMIQKILVEELTEKQRKAMVAIAIKGMPLEEVAFKMGMERNTLYKLLHDARLKLKKNLEKEGLSLADLLATLEEG